MWSDAARATAAAALRSEAPKQSPWGAITAQSLTIGLHFHGLEKRIISQPVASGPHPQKTPPEGVGRKGKLEYPPQGAAAFL